MELEEILRRPSGRHSAQKSSCPLECLEQQQRHVLLLLRVSQLQLCVCPADEYCPREKGEDARIGGVPRMSPSHVRVAGMRARARQTGAGKICM